MNDIIDFTKPDILLDPKLWPSPKSDQLWLLPLDIASVEPGVLTPLLNAVRASQPHAWIVNKKYFYENHSSSRGKRERAKMFLGNQPMFVGPDSDAESLRLLFSLGETPRMMLESAYGPASLEAWAKALAPEIPRAYPERSRRWFKPASGLAVWLGQYEKEFPQAADFPWEGLRFFAGFLRLRGFFEPAQIFETQWAKFSCLFSPQDEESESQSLKPKELMLNPTAQTLKRIEGGLPQIEVIVRSGRSFRTVRLRPIEAAVIDEVQENGRIDEERLIQLLEVEMRGHFPAGDFAEAVAALKHPKILLTRTDPQDGREEKGLGINP